MCKKKKAENGKELREMVEQCMSSFPAGYNWNSFACGNHCSTFPNSFAGAGKILDSFSFFLANTFSFSQEINGGVARKESGIENDFPSPAEPVRLSHLSFLVFFQKEKENQRKVGKTKARLSGQKIFSLFPPTFSFIFFLFKRKRKGRMKRGWEKRASPQVTSLPRNYL